MSSNLAVVNGTTDTNPTEIMTAVITAGDLGKLTPEQRVRYYIATCESLNLNPLTKPFDYIELNRKLVLYPNKGATDQLRELRHIDIHIRSMERMEDVYIVTVEGRTPAGRTDTDIGVVTIGNLKGDVLANALMKCVTKSKRRLTLSICGLNMADETEIETIPSARPVVVDTETGEIHAPQSESRTPSPVTAREMPRDKAAAGETAWLRGIEEADTMDVLLRLGDWIAERNEGTPTLRAAFRRREQALRNEEAVNGPPEQPQRATEGITGPQRNKLWGALNDIFGSAGADVAMRALIADHYGLTSSKGLTKSQASDLIDWLEWRTPAEIEAAVAALIAEEEPGDAPEMSDTEKALAEFREQCEAAEGDAEIVALYDGAGDDERRWVMVAETRRSPAALTDVVTEAKAAKAFTVDVSNAVNDRTRELRARTDRLGQ